jgi:hypothetical protein
MRTGMGLAAAAAVAIPLAGGCGGRETIPTRCQGPAAVTFTSDDSAYLAAELRACAFDVSCTEANTWWPYDQSQGQTARSCLADWNLYGLDGVACAPNATTCDEWMACATHGHCAEWCDAKGYDPQQAGSNLWTCDGDDVIVCGGSGDYGVVWEGCAAEGMHCQTAHEGAACTDGNTCAQPSNPYCVGDRVLGCDGSTLLERSQDCTANGGQCMTIDLGPFGSSAGCVEEGGTACDSSYVPSCQGTVVSFCLFGVVATEDCAAPDIAGTCLVAGGQWQCVPSATECLAATPDSCNGTSFVTCGTDQKLASIDCTTLGFRTCGDVGGRAGCVP